MGDAEPYSDRPAALVYGPWLTKAMHCVVVYRSERAGSRERTFSSDSSYSDSPAALRASPLLVIACPCTSLPSRTVHSSQAVQLLSAPLCFPRPRNVSEASTWSPASTNSWTSIWASSNSPQNAPLHCLNPELPRSPAASVGSLLRIESIHNPVRVETLIPISSWVVSNCGFAMQVNDRKQRKWSHGPRAAF